MGGNENDPPDQANHVDPHAGPPLTAELLADLQAGLLDDEAGRPSTGTSPSKTRPRHGFCAL